MTLRRTRALFTVTSGRPVPLVQVARICVVPVPTAVTSPAWVTVATNALVDDHVTVAWSITAPLVDRTVAVNWRVASVSSVTGEGATSIRIAATPVGLSLFHAPVGSANATDAASPRTYRFMCIHLLSHPQRVP